MTDLIIKTAQSFRHPSRSGAVHWILGAFAAWRSRQKLGALEAHMLDDIGLTQREAMREAHRPLWDVPAHWVDNG